MGTLKTRILNEKQPVKEHKSFAKQLFETWLHAFNLTPQMVNLSEEEIETLRSYFHANILTLMCKEAAVSVAPQTWQEIEERMLKID